jgi:ribulose-5-phosphate 4-epimerase/fuculose-1-phosphate aldolase
MPPAQTARYASGTNGAIARERLLPFTHKLMQTSTLKFPKTPQPPSFASVAEERLHRKQRLAAALRLFSRYGFDEGVSGHITARDPEYQDSFWVNPFGMHFSMIRASDLIRVNHRGEVVEGKHPVNEGAFTIHTQVHAQRPDIVTCAHTHSIYGKSWSSLGRLLDPLSQDACAFYQDHSLFNDYTGVVVELEEGKRIAQTLGYSKAAILKNHGLLTVGSTVDEAAWWFISMERTCQAQLLAQAAGSPKLISHDSATLARNQVGSHYMGWFSFQPLYEMIARQQPELFE